MDVFIPVSGEILRFARVSSGLKQEDIIKYINKKGFTLEFLDLLEKNGGNLLLVDLKKISQVSKRSLSFFFLKKIPEGSIIPTDFRTLPNDSSNDHSINLSSRALLLIRRAKYIQEKATELSSGVNHSDNFLNTISLNDDPEILASKIRRGFSLTLDIQKTWKDPQIALKNWIKLIEKQNIIVLQDSIDIENNFRGFALSGKNNELPLIFLSTKDSPNGRIFTLLHEYCHLMLANGGVTIDGTSIHYSDNIKKIETFCNSFAAAILVPRELFLQEVSFNNSGTFSDIELSKIAKIFGVSQAVIVLRLLEFNRVSKNFYLKKKEEWSKIEKKATKGMKKWDISYLNSNGPVYTSIVYQAYNSNKIGIPEVLSLLNFKSSYFYKVQDQLNKHFFG